MAAGKPGRRRLVIVASAGAVVLAVGALLAVVGRGAPSLDPVPADDHPEPLPAGPPPSAGMADERAAAPGGFARGEDGAVAAVIAYATASQRWLYFTDDEITAAVTEIATPLAALRLAADAVSEIRTARDQLGASPGRVWWLVRPLAWRLDHHTPDEARVSVWVVTVLSAAEVAAPQTEWMTVTIDLAWLEDDWRVDAVHDAPGPTPMTGPGDQPWDAEPFDDTLAGYTRLDGEPVT
jgi:hypothetical protein